MAVKADLRTRYARVGDQSVAYQVHGEGPRDVVIVPGFVSNVEHMWEVPNVAAIFNRFAAFCRLVIWDKRGTGVERASLLGISEGGPLNLN